MSNAAIIIPFRNRIGDPSRAANLQRVTEHWTGCSIPFLVISDGRGDDELFNRSAAYNRGAAKTCAEVLVYVEADVLIGYQQIYDAVALAAARPGIVLPFTDMKTLGPRDSELVRAHRKEPADCIAAASSRVAVGPANVLSRETLNMVGGWDESFEGHGYDDLAMFTAFHVAAGPAGLIEGRAYHLHHLNMNPDDPASADSGLTPADRRAHDRNYDRARSYRLSCSAEEIRELTSGQATCTRP